MARNLLVINVALRETRVALIEDGVIAELQIERARARSTVGNIVLGKVTRVLPGMQAAFIDVGMERAAFLHVEDLIRPDDFEDYLAGAAHALERKTDLDNERSEDGDGKSDEPAAAVRQPPPLSASRPLELAHDDDPDSSDDDDDDDLGEHESAHEHGAVDLVAEDDDEDDTVEDDDVAEDDDEDVAEDDDEDDEDELVSADGSAEDDDEDDTAEDDEDAEDDDDTAEDDDEDVADDDEDAEDDDEDVADDDDDAEDDDEDDEELISADGSEEDDDTEDDDAPSSAHAADADPLIASEDEPDDAQRPRSRRPPRGKRTPSSAPPADAGDQVRVRRRATQRPEAATETDAGWVDEEAPTKLAAGEDGTPASDEQSEPGEQDGRRRRRRRGRRRKSGDSAERPVQAAVQEREQPKEAERGQRGNRRAERPGRRDRGRDKRKGRGREAEGQRGQAAGRPKETSRGQQAPARVSRSVPITEVVREGDEVIVQISKEPIGTKGARVTSHVSLPGRHVVYLPTVDHIGISKRIGSFKERQRLRKAIDTVKPPSGGLIVRTVAEGLTKKNLKEDIGYLLKLWAQVAKKRETARSPDVLYEELDLVLKVARDLFTDEIEKIVIDDKDEYSRIVRFVEMFMPNRVKDVELYSGSDPIFDAYGIEDEIARALSRKVPLPSGGYLILDQAEALTAIDVNTGRYVGKGSKDLEETALKTNLEAVDEIAYQLRFRNIGGLVILDLIDMENPKNRDKVWRALEQRLEKDKAKTTLNRISELGLIEMTRKRTRESLGRTMHEPCFYCDGTGQIMSRTTIAYEILRQVRRELGALPGYSVHVNAHPAIVDLLKTEEKDAVIEAERRYMRRIEFTPRREYHIEQFDLTGK